VKENGYKRDAYIYVSPINLKPVFSVLDKDDAVIVWKKNQPGLGYQWVRRYCEFIIFVSNRDKAKHDTSEFDFWEIATDLKTEYQHGTQKPVALVSRALRFSSVANDLVADWFMGSGTTLIACEQTNRICYGMELDCIYIDVILRRYKNLYPNAEFKCLNNPKFNFDRLFKEDIKKVA
jgi:site-specific DNA-methyltransferase (adenine-specific)